MGDPLRPRVVARHHVDDRGRRRGRCDLHRCDRARVADGGLVKFISWFWLPRCNHACYYMEDMRRREDGMVECRCYKCGKILVATHGLSLDCSLEQRESR